MDEFRLQILAVVVITLRVVGVYICRAYTMSRANLVSK